jgi:hypothetical protein
MCDYSLHYVASRPAKVGDKLVSAKFSNSITGGFAGVGEPNGLPGTEVAFEKDVECVSLSKWTTRRKLGTKVARFRQINKEEPRVHHDALEFPDGQIVLLTRLCVGQHATVLQLPAQAKSPADVEAQRRVAYID